MIKQIDEYIVNLHKEENQVIMGTIELNSDLHKILDRIENEQLLRTIYNFLKLREDAEEGQIWKTLTKEQKKEVYLSYEESRDDKNLTKWDAIKKVKTNLTDKAENTLRLKLIPDTSIPYVPHPFRVPYFFHLTMAYGHL